MFSKLEESRYCALEDNIFLYYNVSVADIIAHLMTMYGDKMTAMLSKNFKNMQDSFDVRQPSIENMYVRQNNLQKFAADSDQDITDRYWMLYT